MAINVNVLKHFYRYNGHSNEFIKNFFIRLIRNRIIDPNTKEFLDRGFKYFNRKSGKIIQVPCDDANFNEFITFDIGFKNNIFQFPFTIKLHHDSFLSLSSYDEFVENIRNNSLYFVNPKEYYHKKSYDKLVRTYVENMFSTFENKFNNQIISLYNLSKDMNHASGYNFNSSPGISEYNSHFAMFVLYKMLLNHVLLLNYDPADTNIKLLIESLRKSIDIESKTMKDIVSKYEKYYK